MTLIAEQPELYTIDGDGLTGTLRDRVFAPVCMLNHKYYLKEYPEFLLHRPQ